jgi:hypothetical protein
VSLTTSFLGLKVRQNKTWKIEHLRKISKCHKQIPNYLKRKWSSHENRWKNALFIVDYLIQHLRCLRAAVHLELETHFIKKKKKPLFLVPSPSLVPASHFVTGEKKVRVWATESVEGYSGTFAPINSISTECSWADVIRIKIHQNLCINTISGLFQHKI